ncbi:MAG: double zinc ribbon domain-containing protein [Candidatus Fervidibacter sp.]|uniref:double zinc ribbon domain-containing protein n=1 Tax=Candidatus Fervidibacter sp. TaxID=3100871 RepID=UPI00404959D4
MQKSWVEKIFDWLYPPRCGVCHRFCDGSICQGCQSQWVKIAHPYCLWCGKPFDPRAKTSPLCGVCLQGRYKFDYARSAVIYEGIARETVHAFKLKGKPRLAEPMGKLMAELLENALNGESVPLPSPWLRPDFLVPVPLHPKTQRDRGYNQAALLAEVVGRHLDIPVEPNLLAQIRPMRPQATLSERERWENVKDAFEVVKPELVKGRAVVVVDDVMTTGSTLNEIAKVLKRAGARRVYCLTFARTVI